MARDTEGTSGDPAVSRITIRIEVDEVPERVRHSFACGCDIICEEGAWRIEVIKVTDYRPVNGPDARVKVEALVFPWPGRPEIIGGDCLDVLPVHLPPYTALDGARVSGDVGIIGRCLVPTPRQQLLAQRSKPLKDPDCQ